MTGAAVARRYPVETVAGRTRYGPWTIYFDPPPIPVRCCDWHYTHDDFDASFEDGEWQGNGLSGSCASFEDALDACDQLDAEPPSGAGS